MYPLAANIQRLSRAQLGNVPSGLRFVKPATFSFCSLYFVMFTQRTDNICLSLRSSASISCHSSARPLAWRLPIHLSKRLASCHKCNKKNTHSVSLSFIWFIHGARRQVLDVCVCVGVEECPSINNPFREFRSGKNAIRQTQSQLQLCEPISGSCSARSFISQVKYINCRAGYSFS